MGQNAIWGSGVQLKIPGGSSHWFGALRSVFPHLVPLGAFTRESHSRESPGIYPWRKLSGCKGGIVRVYLNRSCGGNTETPQRQSYAIRHDEKRVSCLRQILGTPNASTAAHTLSTLSLSAGGLGLASAVRVRPAAHWSSWADSLRMVRQRHRQSQSAWWSGWKSMTPLLASVRSGSASKQFSTLVWRSLIGRSRPTALSDGNSGPRRSWNRSSCVRRCGPFSVTAPGL